MVNLDIPAVYRLADAASRRERVEALPRCAFIEVTNRCNLACAMCVRTGGAQEALRDLTLAEFREVVAQFPTLERAVLHGIGEPLLNGDLPEMIHYLKAPGNGRGAHGEVEVLFNSNGTLLDAAWAEALATSGLDQYRLSLDSADPEQYASVRGKPLLDRVVANLYTLMETKRRLGATLPRVSIWAIGAKETIGQWPALVRLAAELGVPELYAQRFVYRDGGRDGANPAFQTLYGRLEGEERSLIEECERLSAELGVAFRASGATDPTHSLLAARRESVRPWMACTRPWTTAYITAHGNALPCCISPFATSDYPDLVLGNLWERPFAEIWNGARYRAWRAALLSDEPPEACRGCGVQWSL